jgi:hypothetical protein
MAGAIFLVCIFDNMQDEESPSYMFEDTYSPSNIQTKNVSQPTSDEQLNKPFSVDENRYKIFFIYMSLQFISI